VLYDPKLVVFASNNVNKQTRLEAPTDSNQSECSGGSGKWNLAPSRSNLDPILLQNWLMKFIAFSMVELTSLVVD
jgi:hypothetical protein